MAGIGEASAIIGVATFGLKFADTLIKFAGDVKGAHEQIISLSEEVRATAFPLQELGTFAEKTGLPNSRAKDESTRLSDRFDAAILQIRNILKKGDRRLDTTKIDPVELRLTSLDRVWWASFARHKLEVPIAELRRLKADLNLLLVTFMALRASTTQDQKRYAGEIVGMKKAVQWANEKYEDAVRKMQQEPPEYNGGSYDDADGFKSYRDFMAQQVAEREAKKRRDELELERLEDEKRRREEKERDDAIAEKAIADHILKTKKEEAEKERRQVQARNDLRSSLQKAGVGEEQIERVVAGMTQSSAVVPFLPKDPSLPDLQEVSESAPELAQRANAPISRFRRRFRSSRSSASSSTLDDRSLSTSSSTHSLEAWFIDQFIQHRWRIPMEDTSLAHNFANGGKQNKIMWERYAKLHPWYKTQIEELFNEKEKDRDRYIWSMVSLEKVRKRMRLGFAKEHVCLQLILKKTPLDDLVASEYGSSPSRQGSQDRRPLRSIKEIKYSAPANDDNNREDIVEVIEEHDRATEDDTGSAQEGKPRLRRGQTIIPRTLVQRPEGITELGYTYKTEGENLIVEKPLGTEQIEEVIRWGALDKKVNNEISQAKDAETDHAPKTSHVSFDVPEPGKVTSQATIVNEIEREERERNQIRRRSRASQRTGSSGISGHPQAIEYGDSPYGLGYGPLVPFYPYQMYGDGTYRAPPPAPAGYYPPTAYDPYYNPYARQPGSAAVYSPRQYDRNSRYDENDALNDNSSRQAGDRDKVNTYSEYDSGRVRIYNESGPYEDDDRRRDREEIIIRRVEDPLPGDQPRRKEKGYYEENDSRRPETREKERERDYYEREYYERPINPSPFREREIIVEENPPRSRYERETYDERYPRKRDYELEEEVIRRGDDGRRTSSGPIVVREREKEYYEEEYEPVRRQMLQRRDTSPIKELEIISTRGRRRRHRPSTYYDEERVRLDRHRVSSPRAGTSDALVPIRSSAGFSSLAPRYGYDFDDQDRFDDLDPSIRVSATDDFGASSRAEAVRYQKKKLELLWKKFEVAERAHDLARVADLRYYAIPDVEQELLRLEDEEAGKAVLKRSSGNSRERRRERAPSSGDDKDIIIRRRERSPSSPLRRPTFRDVHPSGSRTHSVLTAPDSRYAHLMSIEVAEDRTRPRFGGLRRARTEPLRATAYSYLDDVREEGEGEAEADEDIIARQLSLYAPDEESKTVEERVENDDDGDPGNHSGRGAKNRSSVVQARHETSEEGPSSVAPFQASSGDTDAQQPVPSSSSQSIADEDVIVEEDYRARAESGSLSDFMQHAEPEAIGRNGSRYQEIDSDNVVAGLGEEPRIRTATPSVEDHGLYE